MSRRIRFDLAYDGTDFAGWQVQRGKTTIQSVLEEALARLNGNRRVSVRAAGRTDSGVHARLQVCDFLFDGAASDDELAHALGGMLPPAIRPLALRTVSAEFHARKAARIKHYRYRLDRSRYGNPIHARYALHMPRELDLPALEDALSRIPGRRDWSGFTSSRCDIDDRVREVTVAEYHERGGNGRFEFQGNGFLTHMVRNLVGTLLHIGEGKLRPVVIDRILSAGDRRLAGPTAPAHGLHLWNVIYDDDEAASVPEH
ncbi:MAG: tRNA pseudouridine(38-40) synthase TruA [Acidobacteria bacterium]|nr:tRNA pseudouridine(38-40) synthase TruA [Acidobacteriota bacterium]NIM60551.1 tRNA pseudouridine(38-40) synthase TruA [Acidobacteriota bacterium]NIO59522.1 tRNA pseudouridine(38-40) synthase TruA [Acidobacteriota bacterium]NIQ30551.1 tRNA pseudouridine(38-40) synthase TruA [Acidobacteriota bacterium]NIQ85499.1 tRNA pseudouridine(38-40) synthase TruA [Acidobacteriota bacterium]